MNYGGFFFFFFLKKECQKVKKWGRRVEGRVATYVMLHMRWVGQKVSHVKKEEERKKKGPVRLNQPMP